MKLLISNIRNMLADGQEDLVKGYIDTFSCSVSLDNGEAKLLNPDIERFLNENAIQFAKMKTAITYLVMNRRASGCSEKESVRRTTRDIYNI